MRIDAQIREIMKSVRRQRRGTVPRAVDMEKERAKFSEENQPKGLMTWNNNTVEAVLLFSAVLVCLSGIMFGKPTGCFSPTRTVLVSNLKP